MLILFYRDVNNLILLKKCIKFLIIPNNQMSKRIKLLGTELKIGILVIRWMAFSSPVKT